MQHPRIGHHAVKSPVTFREMRTPRLQALLLQPVAPVVVYVATEMAGAGHVRQHGRGELVLGPAVPDCRLD